MQQIQPQGQPQIDQEPLQGQPLMEQMPQKGAPQVHEIEINPEIPAQLGQQAYQGTKTTSGSVIGNPVGRIRIMNPTGTSNRKPRFNFAKRRYSY